MKRLSFQLGLLFFIFILLIESMLFYFLYFSITNERVESETQNLLSRGMNHRDVLEKNFDINTIEHVALMESEAETMVVITDNEYNVIGKSNDINNNMEHLINKGKSMNFTHHGTLVETRWESQPYLATINPIRIEGDITGYVYMFVGTESIREAIDNLTFLFLLVGAIALLLSVITIFFLSRFITQPIHKMIIATDRLSKGKHDVTLDIYREDELGELSRSIQKLSDTLYHVKKDRSEFLSSISHEFRTPLTYLKGYADILNRKNISKEDQDKFAAIIQEEATNLTELVKELFVLAKMDHNKFTIQKQQTELCQFTQEIIDVFQPAFKEKNIQLNLRCTQSFFAFIDPSRFRQVISNLLDNASKYSSSGSSVNLSITNNNKNIELSVSDQGDGIPAEDIPYIWDRLYRVDKSRSRSLGGSGLGLSIVKEIVERHEGEIYVTSVLGQGTTFTITLPK